MSFVGGEMTRLQVVSAQIRQRLREGRQVENKDALVIAPSRQCHQEWERYNRHRFRRISRLTCVNDVRGRSPEHAAIVLLDNWSAHINVEQELDRLFPGWSAASERSDCCPQVWTLTHGQRRATPNQAMLLSGRGPSLQNRIYMSCATIAISWGENLCTSLSVTQIEMKRGYLHSHRHLGLSVTMRAHNEQRRNWVCRNDRLFYRDETREFPVDGRLIETTESNSYDFGHIDWTIALDRLSPDAVTVNGHDTMIRLDNLYRFDHYDCPIAPPRPKACIGCGDYNGETHGGNKLICGIHPYGWNEESKCPDWRCK